jgi:dolichol-phosphate mannosyltransferase
MIALREGLRNCSGDFTISLDCDLQDPPNFIAELVREYLRNPKIYDCVAGQRNNRESDNLFKRETARIYYWLAKRFISPNIIPNAADFRLITKNFRDELLKYAGSYPIYRILIPLSTNNIKVLNYVRDVRRHGESHYSFRRMVQLASLSFFYFSNLPMVLLNYLVYFSTLFNLSVIVFIFQARFFQSTVPGWSSTVLILSMSMLLIITLINIFGRYTYSNFLRSQGLPLIVTHIESRKDSNERY